MNPDPAPAAMITDPDTLRAIQRLELSRSQVAQWSAAVKARRASGGGGLFQPRSATMRAVMSLGKKRLPWLRWAVPAFMMFKSLRRGR